MNEREREINKYLILESSLLLMREYNVPLLDVSVMKISRERRPPSAMLLNAAT